MSPDTITMDNSRPTPKAPTLEQLAEAANTKAYWLRQLLDEQLTDDDKIIVSSSRMGSSDSYVGSASLEWVEKRLSLFTELNLLKFDYTVNKKGEKELVYDEEAIEQLQQREPKKGRTADMALYVITHPNRKFPALLVVILEDWVDKPNAPEWGPDGRATRTSMPVEFLDSEKRVALLDFRAKKDAKVRAFAIDGAHRLLAVRMLMTLYREGQIVLSEGKKELVLTRRELSERFGISEVELDARVHEKLALEFIPAVMEGETREEARNRTRSIFVHVNKTAQPPTKSQEVMLDEDDGFAIIARRIALHHRLFSFEGKAAERVAWKAASIAPTGNKLIPGKNLRDLIESFLIGKGTPAKNVREPYTKWKSSIQTIVRRPEPSELEAAEKEAKTLFDKIAELPSFGAVLRGDSLDTWRAFHNDDPKKLSGKGHLLMRPLGLSVLATAVGRLVNLPTVGGGAPHLTLNEAFKQLSKYDAQGGFQDVHEPKSPWFGITYANETMLMKEDLAASLLQYLIAPSSLSDQARMNLAEEFGKARIVPQSKGDPKYFNWDGNLVDSLGDVRLPQPI